MSSFEEATMSWMEGELEDGEDVTAEEARTELEAYERKYADERSWERAEFGEQDHIVDEQRRKRDARRISSGLRKGLIRHLVLVLDSSSSSLEGDACYRPTRLAVIVSAAERLIRGYFDQNPLSSLSVISMHDGIASTETVMISGPDVHVEAARSIIKRTGGPASVQNALREASRSLIGTPPYAKREVVMLLSAITSCDPGDIKDTIAEMKKEMITCSVVGISAEVYLFKHLAKDTGGTYFVARDETHFHGLVMAHATPPPSSPEEIACLVRMAFPRKNAGDSLGLFGKSSEKSRTTLRKGGYTCPQCNSRVNELPARCSICELTLISAPDLARSYHHLLPVQSFEEFTGNVAGKRCFGCDRELQQGEGQELVLVCGGCNCLFCFDCDTQIHEVMFVCPGCEQTG